MAFRRPEGRSAVVVIDMQQGVMRDCWDAAGALERTMTLVERARSEQTPVIWVQDEQDFPRDSADWQLAAPLAPAPDEARVFKSYRDVFTAPRFMPLLDDLRVSRLVLAGAQSDFCVRTAGQRAAAEGFDVSLVADCHTTWNGEVAGSIVTGEQIAAQTNAYFAGLRYPGQRFEVVSHREARLT